MITLASVSKKYGDFTALASTDLTFETGQTTALIGPSGCGKSTLLRLIIGLIPATSGTVTIDGQAVTPSNVETVRQSVGYVIQDGGLFPHLTASGNVCLMARYLGRPEDEISVRLKELAELTRMPMEMLERFPLELSGGQRQRVSLMRALMLKPSALLLDEPLGALDPMVRAGLQADLKSIFKQLGQTVVFVTHDMGEAAYLSDKIVLLESGKVVQEGALEDYQERPASSFVSDFLSAQRTVVKL